MNNNFCLMCQDEKRYKTICSDAKRINNLICSELRKIVKVKDNKFNNRDESELKRCLNSGHTHSHFMCGHCVKVNESELRLIENEIINNLVLFYQNYDGSQEHKGSYHYILRYLQGHYSLMYRNLERFIALKTKKIDGGNDSA